MLTREEMTIEKLIRRNCFDHLENNGEKRSRLFEVRREFSQLARTILMSLSVDQQKEIGLYNNWTSAQHFEAFQEMFAFDQLDIIFPSWEDFV